VSTAFGVQIYQNLLPGFSTRRQDGGTGMGLGIARTMLTSHGGEISLMDGVQPGTEFAVVVPLR
jgi:signal transduction histidine kinase